MSANNTTNTSALIRSELWQRQLEEILDEHLLGTPFVRQIDFPDGSAFTMPSMGTALTRVLPEGTEVTFDAIDTGEKQMTLQDPVVAATSVSEVFMEDSLWTSQFMAEIPNRHAVAVMEQFETEVLSLANSQSQGTGNANQINGVDHRFIGTGTNETMAPENFARARHALIKAKVPTNGLIAIVDPSVAYALETSSNLVNVSNNPHWEGVISTGIEKNMRFVKNVYGFDVFESNLLADANETIGSSTTTAGKANIFMAAGAGEMMLPFAVAWRRRPRLDRQFNNLTREEEIITTARWGRLLSREDNLVVVLTDTDQV